MVSGLLNFGTRDQRWRFYIPSLGRVEERWPGDRSSSTSTFCCSLGSALWLGSAFGVFLCGVVFVYCCCEGFVVCWGCLGVAFGWLGSAGPRGTSATLMRKFLISAKGSEPLGSGSTCPGNGKCPAVAPAGGQRAARTGVAFRAKGGPSPVPFRAFGTTKLACFAFSLSGQGLRPSHWRITLRMMPSS